MTTQTRIDSFSGEFRFLSNFYPATVTYDDETYPTIEHAYQAAKTTNAGLRKLIRLSSSASAAKRLGQTVPLRPDWERIKVMVMLDLVRQKFQDADLRTKLLATGSADLIEGNTWNDTFWGVCLGVGKNFLGKILMQVRAEIT